MGSGAGAVFGDQGRTAVKKPGIVIVGAGPAGSSFALSALRLGLECILLDSGTFPRPKLCGGAITRKTRLLAVSLVGEERYATAVADVSNDILIRHDGREVARFKTGLPFDFVDRARYDHMLVEAFVSEGGDFRQNVKALKFDTKAGILETNRGEFAFDHLVCADGANSRMRRLIEPDYRPEGFCYEYRARNEEGSRVVLDFFHDMRGYSWSFPNGENRVLGTGSFYRKPEDAVELKRFLTHYGPVPDRMDGAFIPLGTRPVLGPKEGGKLHFLGDAAGWANPVTGEGLYWASRYAIELAGHLAGKCPESGWRHSLARLGHRLWIYNKGQDIVFNPEVWEKLAASGSSGSGYRKICDQVISLDAHPASFLVRNAWRIGLKVIGIREKNPCP